MLESRSSPELRSALRGYGRGLMGALIVSMPLLATMEMWWLGFSVPPGRLLLFLVANFGLLLVLEYFSGFQKGHVSFLEEFRDAIDAYGMGLVVGTVVLFLFGVIGPGMSAREVVGKIALEAIPLSIGASVAISVLGERDDRRDWRRREAGFWGNQLIGVAGAVYFAFNVAPTEEPVMIGLGLAWWHAVLLVVGGLVLTHTIVHSVGFMGSHRLPGGSTWSSSLLVNGVVSYMSALLVSAFLLWIFGRIGPGMALAPSLQIIVTLAFIGSVGSAAARLLI